MMNRVILALRQLALNEDAPTSVEYAIMVGLIAMAVIGGATALGVNINTLFQTFAGTIGGI